MEHKPKCGCKNIEMEEIGRIQTCPEENDFPAEYVYFYQCPECKRVLLD